MSCTPRTAIEYNKGLSLQSIVSPDERMPRRYDAFMFAPPTINRGEGRTQAKLYKRLKNDITYATQVVWRHSERLLDQRL